MQDYIHDQQQQDAPTASVGHIIRTLRAYLPAMALALAAVAIGYVIVAAAVYILSPSTRLTSLNFRLDFEGADRGYYPNGTKFSGTEIVSTPVLIKTFNENNLGQYTSFADFSSSLFVLQSNMAQEALAREYQARLADQRLNAVDRDRIQREYEMKLASLSKDQYAIQYVRKKRTDAIPETVVRKVLHDILKNWSQFVSNERHVLEYRIAVLSPDVVAGSGSATNPIIDTIMLRDKVLRLQDNIEKIRALPAAELARTTDGLTLADLAVRLDDVVRYRLDPLVNRIATAGLDDRTETIRFLETQLAHDQRHLGYLAQRANAAQQTLSLYLNTSRGEAPNQPAAAARPADSETVMPQISDTFLDRLIQLTASSADTEFRKDLAEEYRLESLKMGPMEQAVAYDQAILDFVRGAGGGGRIDPAEVSAAVTASRKEIRQIAVKVHEIHKEVSRNLNPSTELMTLDAPFTRVERTTSLKRIAMYGVLTLAMALPIIVVLSLLHNHIKQEEADERLSGVPAES